MLNGKQIKERFLIAEKFIDDGWSLDYSMSKAGLKSIGNYEYRKYKTGEEYNRLRSKYLTMKGRRYGFMEQARRDSGADDNIHVIAGG